MLEHILKFHNIMNKETHEKCMGHGWGNRLLENNNDFREPTTMRVGVSWSSHGGCPTFWVEEWLCYGGQARATFFQDRLQTSTRQMWQSKWHIEGQPQWTTESVGCTQSNLAAKSTWDGFLDGIETDILSWDTKRWLKQYWNMEIVDSRENQTM